MEIQAEEIKIKKKRGVKPGTRNALGHDGRLAGGRDEKYKPKFAKMLIEHFEQPSYDEVVYEETVELYPNGKPKRKTVKKHNVARRLPTFSSFARKIGVTYRALHYWIDRGIKLIEANEQGKDLRTLGLYDLDKELKYIEFAKAYEVCKNMQKEILIDLGLSGTAPPASFIFVAKNLTDMTDKTQQDITSNGESLGVAYLPPKKELTALPEPEEKKDTPD